MKKIGLILALSMMLIFGAGVVKTTTAHAADLTSVVKDIQGNKGGVLGSETKGKVLGLSKDSLDIVMIIVTAIVLISGLITGTKFANVGDDATKKSKLKVSVVMHILGLLFLANYFGLFDFIFNKVKMF